MTLVRTARNSKVPRFYFCIILDLDIVSLITDGHLLCAIAA